MIFIEFIYTLLCVFLALQFPKLILVGTEKASLPILRKLVLFHFLMGFFYYLISNNGGGDAWGYWYASKEMSSTLFYEYLSSNEGTYFMYAFNYPFAKILRMGFFSNTMVYSMLGSFAVTLLFVIIMRTVSYTNKVFGYYLFPLILFLPNLHFWSGGLGKDTVLFLCIITFAYGLMKPLSRLSFILISLIISLGIRPHITLMLIVSFGIAYLFDEKISKVQRIIISSVLLIVSVIVLPKALQIAKMDELSVSEFENFATSKSQVLSGEGVGSSVDISGMPFPLKILTFLFRPFFFDVRNVQALILSFENLFLFILISKIAILKPVEAFKKAPYIVKGFLIFFLVGTVAFSGSLGNIGIMIRMKNMFMPGLILFILWVFSYNYQKFVELNKKQICAE